MKKTLLFSIALLIAGATVQAQAPTPDLIWLKFDGSGNTVPNMATNPPAGTATATLMGGITQGASPICNGAAIGTGVASSTDYVNTGWTPSLGNGSWTIAWRSSGISTNATLYYIFGDAGTNSFRCFTNGVAGSTNWIIRGAGLTDTYINGGALSTPTSCAFVYDQGTNTVKGYLNGVLVSTVGQTAPNLTGTGPLKVMGYSSNVGAPAGGFLDDFRLYGRALTDTEIMAVVNGDFHTGFMGADASLCPGDTLPLSTSPYITNTTTWSTGSTNDTLLVDTAGTYAVSWAGNCEAGADTINITLAPALPGAGFAGSDATICTGDTALLSVSTVEPVLWSTGDTTTSVQINTVGTYTVTVNGQCGTVTDTVDVLQSALVYSGFIAADTNAACDGDTINLMSTAPYTSYLWSTNDTTMSTSVFTGGTYVLTVADGCGSGTDSIVVAPFYASVNAAFSFSTNLLSATFTNTSTGGGNVTYAWNFGDGNTSTSTNPNHTYGADGSYVVSLEVTNECGTMTVFDTVVVNSVGIDQAAGFVVTAIPNPARDRVVVEAVMDRTENLQISLINLQGQVVRTMDFNQVGGSFRQELNLEGIAKGTYLLQVSNESNAKTIRLVIQ